MLLCSEFLVLILLTLWDNNIKRKLMDLEHIILPLEM